MSCRYTLMYMGIHVCAHQYVYINSVYQCALGTSQGYLKLTSGRIWGGTQEWMLPSSQVVLMLLVQKRNVGINALFYFIFFHVCTYSIRKFLGQELNL